MVNNIAYSKDIIASVSKELGLPEKQVEYVLDTMVKRIKDLTRREDCFNIAIPGLGFMYMNAGNIERQVLALEYLDDKGILKDGGKKKKDLFKKKVERIENLLEKTYTPHKKRTKLYNTYFNLGLNLRQLEDKQNKDE